jgi:esterase/lipase
MITTTLLQKKVKPPRRKEMRYRLISEASGIRVNGKIMLPAHASASNPVPGAVLCHGFGADQRVMESSALLLVNKGIATITFDLRGHGFSGGWLDGNFCEDVINAWRMLTSVPEVDNSRIALVGHSLGALSSIIAAKTVKPRAIVALSCPFEIKGTILNDFSHKAYPLAMATLAFFWKLTILFNGIKVNVNWKKFLESLPQMKLSSALAELDQCEKLFVFSAGDRLTPYKRFAQIYENAPRPKQKMLTRGSHATPLEAEILRFEWVGWLVKALSHHDSKNQNL